ncbi:MAG: hypothetical protein KA314_26600 [Chloroflexi bacterium]|nr:hypothetical protein [Chloroflexota bacterium]MBP8059421.1 hypothetical protein [Chloroflexota bacterium]
MDLRPHQTCPELAEGENENNATIFIPIRVSFIRGYFRRMSAAASGQA